jgi:hypothetical protein
MKAHLQTWLTESQYIWMLVSVLLLVVFTIAAMTAQPGPVLTVSVTLGKFLMISIASLLAFRNAWEGSRVNRQFWSFVTAGYVLWSVSLAILSYYHDFLRRDVPDNSVADIALFLHLVPLIAAVATRPHLQPSSHGIYRASVNFLVLLFFWVFVYAFFLFPYQYLFWDTVIYNSRFSRLYFVENLATILSFGGQIWLAKPPWRAIYFHLWGASFLYGVSSVIANAAIDARKYHVGSLYDLPLLAAMCWFLLVPLQRGQKAALEGSQLTQEKESKFLIPLLARLTILAIPVVGVWEMFRPESSGMQRFRLLVVLASVLFLALCVLIKEFLTYRELSSLLAVKGQELQSALSKVKLLSGLLPICASCKKIRDRHGHWQHLEAYLREHSEAEFSHGICPDCGRQLYGERFRE